MCIAIIKPVNESLPSWEILERGFTSNPDGAGFAYSDGKFFEVRKGLQTWAKFKEELEAVLAQHDEAWQKATFMAFHFRIGTHGSKGEPEHTHPFPVAGTSKALCLTEYRSRRIAMHNGILSDWGDASHAKVSKYGGVPLSDTMDFIKNFVFKVQTIMPKGETIYDNKHAQELLGREVAGSRFVIMEADGRFVYWGTWDKHEGCYYSNAGYKKREEYKWPAYSTSKSTSRYWDDYLDGLDAGWYTSKKADVKVPVLTQPSDSEKIVDMASVVESQAAARGLISVGVGTSFIMIDRKSIHALADRMMYVKAPNILYEYKGKGLFKCLGRYSSRSYPHIERKPLLAYSDAWD